MVTALPAMLVTLLKLLVARMMVRISSSFSWFQNFERYCYWHLETIIPSYPTSHRSCISNHHQSIIESLSLYATAQDIPNSRGMYSTAGFTLFGPSNHAISPSLFEEMSSWCSPSSKYLLHTSRIQLFTSSSTHHVKTSDFPKSFLASIMGRILSGFHPPAFLLHSPSLSFAR